MDDIANHKRNPFPGQIFNHPDGKNVYDGVKIDYYGEDVTPENFIAVLTGDANSVTKADARTSGKVLTSTEDDRVFIYFSDHGDLNVVSFPNKYLYADELNDAFKVMNEKGMYKELIMYLEACYSGSMFDNELSPDLNIYVTTAANSKEVSYAEYCSSQALVNKTLIGACLGDEYSARFMEDIDARPIWNLDSYTFQEQYEYLVKAIEDAHVMQYGDLTIAQKPLADFFVQKSSDLYQWLKNAFKKVLPPKLRAPTKYKINNEFYRLEWFRLQAEMSSDVKDENEYYEEIMAQGRVTKIFELFNQKFNLGPMDYEKRVDYDCYREVANAYKNRCGTLIDRDVRFMKNIANFCTKGINPKKADLTFKSLC